MDSAGFLSLVVLLQILAMHCPFGEADDLVTERRLESYRKKVVTSLSKIVKKKIPLHSGTELGRAIDTYTCGKCYLSSKATDDNKCIKSCTRIVRFASISPAISRTNKCDTCVARALSRPNRFCDDKCSVRDLTAIMADVVNDSVSFRERALLSAGEDHQEDGESAEPEIDESKASGDSLEPEPLELRSRTRRASTFDRRSTNLDYINHESQRNAIESDLNEPGNESGISGRFTDSSQRLLNRYKNIVHLKHFDEGSKFFHPDDNFSDAKSLGDDEGGPASLEIRSENLGIEDYDASDDLNNHQQTKQASRSGGGLSLRGNFSENSKSLNKLGSDQQSNNHFTQQTKSVDLKDLGKNHHKPIFNTLNGVLSNRPAHTSVGGHRQQGSRSRSSRYKWPIEKFIDKDYLEHDYENDDEYEDEDEYYRGGIMCVPVGAKGLYKYQLRGSSVGKDGIHSILSAGGVNSRQNLQKGEFGSKQYAIVIPDNYDDDEDYESDYRVSRVSPQRRWGGGKRSNNYRLRGSFQYRYDDDDYDDDDYDDGFDLEAILKRWEI